MLSILFFFLLKNKEFLKPLIKNDGRDVLCGLTLFILDLQERVAFTIKCDMTMQMCQYCFFIYRLGVLSCFNHSLINLMYALPSLSILV
uniref:Uncharacterized protein n=1 Tax=Cannabis sativa TaxID=3483 RepID=A0A803R826_CANSA